MNGRERSVVRRRSAAALRVLVTAFLLPLPHAGRAQPTAPAAPAASTAADSSSGAPGTPATPASGRAGLDQARDLIKNGDYDRAIELLRGSIAKRDKDAPELREAYLLLIKTYVFLGNDYKFRPQGREASNLNYRAAREQIAECLAIPALRHTQPEPATDYPPEMITFFAEVRSRMFGGFRVVGLAPAGAVVLLGGETLAAPTGSPMPGVDDLPVGTYGVTVRATGYKDLNETITISPSATLERSYRLEKRRSALWYASRWTGAAGVIAGAVALIAGGRGVDSSSGPPALPEAPPPPPSP